MKFFPSKISNLLCNKTNFMHVQQYSSIGSGCKYQQIYGFYRIIAVISSITTAE